MNSTSNVYYILRMPNHMSIVIQKIKHIEPLNYVPIIIGYQCMFIVNQILTYTDPMSNLHYLIRMPEHISIVIQKNKTHGAFE